jgi:hypothetical protein
VDDANGSKRMYERGSSSDNTSPKKEVMIKGLQDKLKKRVVNKRIEILNDRYPNCYDTEFNTAPPQM